MVQQTTSPYTGNPITEWYDYEIELHDADGDEIGNVVEVNPDFIVVQASTGFLGLGEPRTYFIPRDQVTREDEDDWYLSIDKDEIESMGWLAAPTSSRYAEVWAENRVTDYERSDRTRLIRYEEDLDVQKVARNAGDVTVSKRVVEDTKTVEVPVRREEVHVERRPVTGEATTGRVGDDAFTEDRIMVPVMEEDVEVRKVTRPVEEVEITKSATEDTKRVDQTIRREQFDIDDDTKRR
jgi:uncharacterized protein (TIGR02271 family)